MRVDLAKYINRYVLCKGWITDWEQINETTFRAFIEKPLIKKPNKNAVWDDLETLSREHHINLFLPYNIKKVIHTRDMLALHSQDISNNTPEVMEQLIMVYIQ